MMSSSKLDNSSLDKLRKRFDPSDQLSVYLQWYQDTKKMISTVKVPQVSTWREKIQNIVFLGMGGSALGAELALALSQSVVKVPAIIVRGYELPTFVDENTLAIAVSYSGNTIETLTTIEAAIEKGAMAAAVTSGGSLAGLAEKHGFPVIPIEENRQPRASTPLLTAGILAVLEGAGLFPSALKIFENDIRVFKEVADENSPTVPTTDSRSKQLANFVMGKIPLFVGVEPYYLPALIANALFSETAKMITMHEMLPEQNHNKIIAWSDSPQGDAFQKSLAVVLIMGPNCIKPVLARTEYFKQRVSKKSGHLFELAANSQNYRQALLELTLVIDLATVYAALLNESDPEEIVPIVELKKKLKELGFS